MSSAAVDRMSPDLLSYLDGAADDAAVGRLDAAMRSDPALRRQFAALCVEAREIAELLGKATGAEAIIDESPAAKAEAPPVAGRVRWIGVGVAVGAAAAVAIVAGVAAVAYLRGAAPTVDTPSNGQGAAMAVLTGSESVRWTSEPWEDGQTLGRQDLSFESGRLDLEFLGGASTQLVGPAEFAVTGSRSCWLGRGRIEVDAGGGGGFTVATPAFDVIDIGTRFTVVYTDAEASVEVVEGVVMLAAPKSSPTGFDTIVVRQGQTAVIDRTGDAVAGIRVVEWIDLAAVIGGAEGGGGVGGVGGIDMRTGQPAAGREWYLDAPVNRFVAVDHPYIDGVVVPDGGADGATPVPISSTGLTMTGLPATSGKTYDHVWAGPAYKDATALIAGTDYAAPGHTQIGLHPNKAITFDLAAMRRDRPGARSMRLTAVAAMAPNSAGVADVLVAVDGAVRFSAIRMRAADPPHAIDLGLPDDARFVTLIATDGGGDISSDWPVLGDVRISVTADPARPDRQNPNTPGPGDDAEPQTP